MSGPFGQCGLLHGRTPGEVRVARVLRNPAVTGAIVGAGRPGQLQDVAGAAEFQLGPDGSRGGARKAARVVKELQSNFSPGRLRFPRRTSEVPARPGQGVEAGRTVLALPPPCGRRHFSGSSLMFLNQQSPPWSCRPMWPLRGWSL